MKKITIKDIAIALNKSQSTISKALSNSIDVSVETKQLVKEYATRHNFQTNKIGRSLRTGKSMLIGVVLMNITDPFYGELLGAIEEEISVTNYYFILMQSKENSSMERHCIDKLFNNGIDGLLISTVINTPNIKRLEELTELGFPVVNIDRINHKLTLLKSDKNFNVGSSCAVNMGRQSVKQMMAIINDDK